MNKSKVTFSLIFLIVAIIMSQFLGGCSMLAGLATDAVTGQVAKGDPLLGVDTEIVAGDKQQGIDTGMDVKFDDIDLEDNASITTNTTGRNTDIQSAERVTLNEGVEYWQAGVGALIMLLLGLFLPQYFKVGRNRNE